MITTNVFSRVFQIQFNGGIGTCFAIDCENKQYIITAKHVVEGLTNNHLIKIFHANKWVEVNVKLIGHHKIADVSVFALYQQLAFFELEPTTRDLTCGQDLYFLGFPFKLRSEIDIRLNNEFPFPLVKKGILSAIMQDNAHGYFFLDGHNNPGFSGGPVVFKPTPNSNFRVAAIISAYRFDNQPVLLNGNPTESIIQTNTGIILAPRIENALELIKANPIGFPIKAI